jgi:hypothetical protein
MTQTPHIADRKENLSTAGELALAVPFGRGFARNYY